MNKSTNKLEALITRIGEKDSADKRIEQGGQLYDLWKTGEYPTSQILYAQAMMAQYDPANYPRMTVSPEELVERYNTLKRGQYILGLRPFRSEKAISGVVAGEPTDFRVVLPASSNGAVIAVAVTPDVRFSVFMTGHDSSECHQMAAGNLSFGVYGHEAIEAAIAEVRYCLVDSNQADQINGLFLPDNYSQLQTLDEHLKKLYELGMPPVGSTALDEALLQGAHANDLRRNMLAIN